MFFGRVLCQQCLALLYSPLNLKMQEFNLSLNVKETPLNIKQNKLSKTFDPHYRVCVHAPTHFPFGYTIYSLRTYCKYAYCQSWFVSKRDSSDKTVHQSYIILYYLIHEDIQGDKDTCIQIEWEKFFQGTAFTSRLSILTWLCTQHSGVDLKWWIESRCLESRNMYGGNKILIRLAPNSKYSWLKLTRPFTRINTWHRDNETKLQWNWVASEAYDTRKLSLTCIFEPIVLEPASYVLHLVGRFLGVFFKYDLWRH